MRRQMAQVGSRAEEGEGRNVMERALVILFRILAVAWGALGVLALCDGVPLAAVFCVFVSAGNWYLSK